MTHAKDLPPLASLYFDTAPGIRLHAKVCGPVSAPVLLFVHGFPEFWLGWRAQLAEFGRDYRCVAIDLRGFNLSSQPLALQDYRVAKLLADLRAVIAALGAPVHAVVAHDWGGALAWSLAAQSPELMHKLAILNAPHTVAFAHALAHDPEQIAASQYMNFLRSPGSEAVLAQDQCQYLCEFADLQTEEEKAIYRAGWSHGLTGACNLYRASPLHPDEAGETAASGGIASLAAQLKPEDFAVRVPTQVIWGDADTALRPVLLQGLQSFVPVLRIHMVEGASHWLARTHAADVNRVLRAFLA
jgi:pimeloyl-ACP methyl ester carboxylesterase